MDYIQRMRNLREDHDKTQQEIAAEMGLSQRAVGKQLQQLKNFFRKF